MILLINPTNKERQASIDEARTHGVGYFQFSTDEEERAKQQRELEKQRLATLSAQKEREEQRKARDMIIKERVRAAKNRQRARIGLSPLGPEDDEKTEQDEDEARKRDEEEEAKKKRKEEEEKLQEIERQKHIRPWDEDKTPADAPKEWVYKPEREPMSQEQWVDLKRQERPKEFGPVVEKPPAENTFEEEDFPEENKQLYFTSKKVKKPLFRKRNYTPESSSASSAEPVPIHNELSDDSDDDTRKKGAEFAPPPTYDYYGPSSSKQSRRPGVSQNELERSIEAGLKFLRDQSGKGGNKNKWTANSDY
ncbi:hypothetical protein DMENIID0001_088970 [Sergentomyia squamirostris]